MVVLGSRLVAAVRLGDIIVVVGAALVLVVRLDVDGVVLIEVNIVVEVNEAGQNVGRKYPSGQ